MPYPPRRRPPPEPRRLNPGRLAAARALMAVDTGEHVEDALAKLAPRDPADRALAWHLALGVLRTRSALDAAIREGARRAPWTLDPPVLAALRLGLFELWFSRTPPHAAVDQAVEACRAAGAPHASGLVNAVLRRAPPAPTGDEALGHPDWLVARWRARYGEAADAWMRANNQPAPIYVVAKEDPAGVARDFQHRGMAITPVAEGVFRLPEGAGAVEALPGYEEGRWWVMDPAAVAVADLVGEAPEVLDACAAPGGKSFRLASHGARVFATDVDAERLARVQEGAERLDLPVWAEVHDWTQGPLERTFPAVLVDAPCTGLGTLRRHPDIRWRRKPDDIARNAERQRVILGNVAQSVAPGGVLVYAVCSPEPEEGEEVAQTLGWPEEARFVNAPALGGEDCFQAFRLRKP